MPAPFHLYNTLSRRVEALQPLHPPTVTIYTCGQTVYSAAQIGNYRCYIFEDVLVKTLRHLGYQVERAMNITDVGHLTSDQDEGDDKLEVGARREGITAWEVARKYERAFLNELSELNIERPARLIRATEAIPQQIALVQTLEEKGHTYRLPDGIYFDSSTFPRYGQLARLDVAGLQGGARVAVTEGKRHITDFALWKFSPADSHRDMEWESPWGKGFPGWHLECSAIAMEEFGPQLDIHCGGVDHIPVHHTNEIAQSESATGLSFARYWMHCEFLQIDGGKMSKSLGNGYTLADLEAHGFEPLAFRLFTFSAGYRSKLNFTWEGLAAAQAALGRLRTVTVGERPVGTEVSPQFQERFDAALADDLNMPEAMAAVWETIRSPLTTEQKKAVLAYAEPILSLGLFGQDQPAEEIPDEVRQLLQKREEARAAKEWEVADELRERIKAAGFTVSDPAEGGPSQVHRIKQPELDKF